MEIPARSPFLASVPRGRMTVEIAEEWACERCEIRSTDQGQVLIPTSGPWLVFDQWSGAKRLRQRDFSAMHCRLADVECTPSSVLDFARLYGPLGWRFFYPPGPPAKIEWQSRKVGITGGTYAESYWDWALHIAMLSELVALEKAGSQAHYDGAGSRYLVRGFATVVADSPADIQSYFGWTTWPHMSRCADEESRRREIQGHVGWYFRELCWPELQFGSRPRIRVESQGVLGAAYASFAETLLGGGYEPVKCHGCREWFVPRRSNQLYCGPSCKTRGKRRRKAAGEIAPSAA